MESLPFLLLLALLLFGTGLTVYLWDLDLPAAQTMLAVTSIECAFYAVTTVIATAKKDYPFQTPLSVLLSKILLRTKKFIHAQVHTLHAKVPALPKGVFTGLTTKETNPDQVVGNTHDMEYTMEFENPAFWRQDPLFTSPAPKDAFALAGSWLLERSYDSSAAAAVAAAFPEFQWPSHPASTTALVRLKVAYVESFQAALWNESALPKALQSAAAYYVLYHTRLIWSASKSREVEVEELPRNLPPDLLLLHREKWNGYGLFEYLLRTGDRLELVGSAQFLSYIAPYWFCGDSDSRIESQRKRLPALYNLIDRLESSKLLTPETLTNCVLSVGAATDFPLHPKDLIRVDKRCVLLPTSRE